MLKAVLVLSFCVLFLAGGYAAETKRSSGGFTDQEILAEFTIAKGTDLIVLPVRFKGEEYMFFLDTGCSLTAFDISFKSELGEAKRRGRGMTSGGLRPFESFDAPEAFLGPLNLQDCGEVFCADLKMVSSILGRKVSGAIGMNFLRKYVVQIDFDKGKLLFLKPMAGENPYWGEALEIEYHPIGWPYVTGIILDGIKVDFVIDTGDSGTGGLLHVIFKKIISEKEIKTSEAIADTAGGIIRFREARIANLSIGTFQYKDLVFSESNLSHLGLGFLSRHIVTFDFPNSKVYFKKGKEFKKVDETDMSGLHLLRISDKTVVHSVDEGSPAHKAGIRANDVILKVNNKDANEYEMGELRRVLRSGDKQKIMMTIKRGDDVKEVSFLLKKKI